MDFSMKSKTKVTIDKSKISEIIKYHLDKEVLISEEIISGFYNTIYYIKTSEEELILKVAPSKNIKILTYEEDILQREVKVYKLLDSLGVPVPKVLVSDYSKLLIDSNYFIMNYIEGNTLFELKNKDISKDDIYYELMEYVAKIHSFKMDTFGYDNFKKNVTSLKDAFFTMIDNLLFDALKVNLELPNYVIELVDKIKGLDSYLVYNNKPSLLHFDLWEGNIYVKDNRIIGLIDTERSLNFEPIMEFVAMHIDIFDQKNKKYVDHYNKYANEKIVLNDETLIKYRLYQVYMYLLIVVECPYRDIDGSFNDQKNWGLSELKKLHTFFTKKFIS